MAFFTYKARDRQGALITGSLEAVDKGQLEAALDGMGLIPIRVDVGMRLPSLDVFRRYIDVKEVPEQEIIIFSRQMATLFGAGVPLMRALSTLELQAGSKKFAAIIKTIRTDVEAGSSLSVAIAKHKRVFPEFYPHMVEAGEAGGILDDVLGRIASMLEKNAENRAKVKSATLYPKIVVGALVIAITVLMYFVVPRFVKMYASFNVTLPLPTRMLIHISNVFTSYWHIGIIAVAAVFIAWRFYVLTPSGALRWDGVKLKLPIFGPILLKSVLSRFSRVLGSLYKSGLPILQSLDIASRAVENKALSAEIKSIEVDVRAGKTLSAPMSVAKHFPPLVVQMVAVGEDTGNLDEMLDKVAEYYDQEVDASIRNLTTTLEPVLLGFIFVIVLFLALAIFLPMWDIIKVVKR
ncbi:MAG: type II secretion system F family protein [Deltaproteobacteria bacterium]|nr:type II secretion system F family protein [Deltaproteobacteria bacterium]